MSASPEMAALVDELDAMAVDHGKRLMRTGKPGASPERKAAIDALLAAIAKIEAARDEATRRLAEEKATVAAQSLDLFGAIDAQDKAERRLAVVEEAVRQAVTDLNFAAATRSIMMVDRAIDDLNAVIHTEKQP